MTVACLGLASRFRAIACADHQDILAVEPSNP
jgi:hypothetical protein